HPARYRLDAKPLITAASTLGIDGVEAYYAYGNPSPWTPSPDQTQTVKGLADRFNLLVTCGTDSHGTNLLQRL
ncbi:MAG TPA: PHP domain-containing protein, partial [Coleofasciculaceae cyanobacterium]